MNPFADADAVAKYAEGPPKLVPGYFAMLSMARILISERVPENGRILVLGAGGGLEIKLFAEAQPGWTFDGVDPSAEMLKLAEQTLGPLTARVRLRCGFISDAPEEPFDAATSILVMHFVPVEERRSILMEIRRRLKPGAPFVAAHFSFTQGEGERELWFSRYAAFAIGSGIEPEKATNAISAMNERLTILTPEQDESMLRDAGFTNVMQFYMGFTFRGWVGYA